MKWFKELLLCLVGVVLFPLTGFLLGVYLVIDHIVALFRKRPPAKEKEEEERNSAILRGLGALIEGGLNLAGRHPQ
jgi:hypothetical protein